VALYRIDQADGIEAPTLVVALDGWVDAGMAATLAASQLADEAGLVATFDGDALYDYRARRPTLEIVDGRLAELTWPELTLRIVRLGDRHVLVLTGHEPDYRWPSLATDVIELAGRLGVVAWISLGAIPAAVPHTRPVPIIGTESKPGLLRGEVAPGPSGILRVPSALISVLEMAAADAGLPAVGYFAQVPHYVSGPYPAAAVELLGSIGRHLDADVDLGELPEEARQLRDRLDSATAVDETSRAYVERLEGMVDEARLPSGDDLIGEIERFLRDRGSSEGSQRP
jgi:hypothetical protein